MLKINIQKRLSYVSVMLIILIALSSQVFAADNTPRQIMLSWTKSPKTTQTIAWASAADSGKVQYMKQSEKTDDFSGALEETAACSALYDGINHFEAEINKLEPGTAYIYRVGTDGSWSMPAVFETEAVKTDSFSFMDLGDVQDGEDTSAFKNLLQNAYTNYPETKFALINGDLIDKPSITKEWTKFFEATAGVFDRIPMFPTLGNHDYIDPSLYYNTFALPQNGPDGYKEQFYSFDYGNAHFVVLNSNIMGNSEECQPLIDWLKSDLQASGKKWKFAVFHHPPYGVNSGNSGDDVKAAMMQEKWVPVLEENGVDIVFVGHQHMYMRTFPIKNGQVQERQTDGITYVMQNSSNKWYINPETHDYIKKVYYGEKDGTNIYTIINIEGDKLTMTARSSADGSVKDEFVIDKSGCIDCSVEADSVKLLDSAFNQTDSAKPQERYYLQAHLSNHTSKKQNVTAVIQVRMGGGASAVNGGEPVKIVSMSSAIPTDGAYIYTDFLVPDITYGTAFVDVFVLNEADIPVSMPYRKFSFEITP